MADEPPFLRVVAETPEWEREKAEALRDLEWDTRELAANLLRIIRGAGKPHLLPQQIIDLSERILQTSKTARSWAVWAAIEDTLQSAIPDSWDATEREGSYGTIVRGSLQYAASRLVRQAAQEAAGRSEICDGIERQQRSLQRMRERFMREEAELLAALKPRRKPRKTKAKSAAKPQPVVVATAAAATEQERPKSTAEFMKARQKELHGAKRSDE